MRIIFGLLFFFSLLGNYTLHHDLGVARTCIDRSDKLLHEFLRQFKRMEYEEILRNAK